MSRPTIAFTSGCFDAGVHAGHRHLLREAGKLADTLIIGLNSDDYIRRKKGRNPVRKQIERMYDLVDTGLVNEIRIFNEDGPLKLILEIRPDFIVVGDDYSLDQIVGAKECAEWGGQVILVPRLPGISTTEILAAQNSLST